MNKPIVIFGAGELAEVAAFYFEHDTDRQVKCFTVDSARIESDTFYGKSVVPFEELATSHPPADYDAFVAVGYSRINGLRAEKCEAARAMGFRLASYVSTKATTFANFTCGWNAFILEDNTIQPFARIGNGVTLWSGNHIGHHSSIGDYAFISSHVVISGGVKVGARSFMGVNSTTNDHIEIGERCVVGSGAVIVRNLGDEAVVTQEPAKISKVLSSRLQGF